MQYMTRDIHSIKILSDVSLTRFPSLYLSLSLCLTNIKCFCFINVWRDKFGYWEIASLFLRKTRKVIMSYISFPILPSLQAGWRLSGSSSPGISGLSSPLQSRPRALISPRCFAILLSGPPIFRGGDVHISSHNDQTYLLPTTDTFENAIDIVIKS